MSLWPAASCFQGSVSLSRFLQALALFMCSPGWLQLDAHRTIVIEAVDATHCRHSVVGDVKVRMFGIGRLAEKGVIDSTAKTFKQLPYVIERCTYLAIPVAGAMSWSVESQ